MAPATCRPKKLQNSALECFIGLIRMQVEIFFLLTHLKSVGIPLLKLLHFRLGLRLPSNKIWRGKSTAFSGQWLVDRVKYFIASK